MAFQDKVVLVTGASSGIGAATAIKFAEEGALVSLVGRNQEKLNTVAKKCGLSALVLVADISKDEDANRIVSETVNHFGKLDILINNAGIADPSSIEQDNAMTVFDRVIATNLRAPVLITNRAVSHLVKTKGNIINISSVAAVNVFSKDCFAYCTSKAALDHFTRSIALELAPKGVRANTVNPGPVRTDIARNMGATEEQIAAFDEMGKLMPLQRVSESEEVADLVLFLASDKAIAITGSAYFTDNGMTNRLLELSKFNLLSCFYSIVGIEMKTIEFVLVLLSGYLNILSLSNLDPYHTVVVCET